MFVGKHLQVLVQHVEGALEYFALVASTAFQPLEALY